MFDDDMGFGFGKSITSNITSESWYRTTFCKPYFLLRFLLTYYNQRACILSSS